MIRKQNDSIKNVFKNKTHFKKQLACQKNVVFFNIRITALAQI